MSKKNHIYFGDGSRREAIFSTIYGVLIIILSIYIGIVLIPEDAGPTYIIYIVPVFFIFLNFCLTYFHEYAHKFFAKFFGYETKVEVQVKNFLPKGICHFRTDQPIKRKHFLLILIAPLVTLIPILLISLFLSQDSFDLYFLFWILLLFKLAGLNADLYMVWETFRLTKKGGGLIYTESKKFRIL